MASIRKRGKGYYFRVVDGDGVQRERRGCTDRRQTEAMAAAAEAEAAQVRNGYVDPRAVAIKAHDGRPLADHVADWHRHLVAKGGTAKHADLSRNRVTRLVDLAKARRVSDVSLSGIQGALKRVRDEGASLQSIRHYARVVKAFSRWLHRDGRAREDSLAHLTSQNPDPDRRRERRALTADEQARLIAATRAGGVVMRLPGPDRAALYLLALGTGFRAAELRSLAPGSFDLAADPPTVTVAAGYSKHRRDDVQPIRADLARFLAGWLADKPAGSPIFGRMSSHTNLMIRADLRAAGIPERDDAGRVVDFHALLHTFISALAMSRAPVKVIQSLARHSTPTLTLGVYAHVGLSDQTAALSALPPVGSPGTEAATLAATGTDGPTDRPTLALPLPYPGGGTTRNRAETRDRSPADSGADRPTREPSKGGQEAKNKPREEPEASGGGGIRTPGTLAGPAVFKTAAIDHSATPPDPAGRPGRALTGRLRR